MAVTYGFYDSLNHDRLYNAQQMSAIFDGIINDGVFMSVGNQFHTVAGTGMQVIVKSGRAWFDSTWTLNDAEYPLSIDAADVLLTRIDAVVLEVNSEVATRANTIKVVKGTPASTPAKPTLTNTATIHQHALAYVTVAKNITAITNSMIEIVVGKTETPYVTAILQTTDITDLFNQWEDYFQTWFDTVRSTLDGDVALNLQNQITTLERSILKGDTKTSMGLPSTAVGDDAFNYLLDKQNKSYDIPYYPQMIVFTESVSSFNIPFSLATNYIDVIAVGGGGGVGGSYKTNNSPYRGYGGGGGGGYIREARITINSGDILSITIGAGGEDGQSWSSSYSAEDGSNGGNTILYKNNVAVLTANGGDGGKRGTESRGGDGGSGGSGGGGGGGEYYGGNGGNGATGGGGGGGGVFSSSYRNNGGNGGNGLYGGGGAARGGTPGTGQYGGNGGAYNTSGSESSNLTITSPYLLLLSNTVNTYNSNSIKQNGGNGTVTSDGEKKAGGGGGGLLCRGGSGGYSSRSTEPGGGGGGGKVSSGYPGGWISSSNYEFESHGGGGGGCYSPDSYIPYGNVQRGGRGLTVLESYISGFTGGTYDTTFCRKTEYGVGGPASGQFGTTKQGVLIMIVYVKKE